MQETDSPTVDFYDQILQLKLFILDAESLGVLPLVDDFSIRKNHDFFFGEDHLWLREVRGSRPRGVNQLLRAHFDFYPRFYTSKGNHALLRCVRSAAQRVADNKGITDDLQWLREGEDRVALDEVALDNDRSRFDMSIGNNYRSFRFSRAISTRGSTRVDKGAFIRFWTLASKDKHQRVLEQDVNVLDENEPVEDLRSNRQMANNGDLESTSREFYNRVRDIMTNQQEDQHFDDEFSRFLDFDAVAESVKDEESQNDRRGKLTLKAMKSRNQILREEGEKAESSVNNRAKKRNLWTRTRKILARKPTELSETTDKNAGSRA